VIRDGDGKCTCTPKQKYDYPPRPHHRLKAVILSRGFISAISRAARLSGLFFVLLSFDLVHASFAISQCNTFTNAPNLQTSSFLGYAILSLATVYSALFLLLATGCLALLLVTVVVDNLNL
jgi:hypothetical protein